MVKWSNDKQYRDFCAREGGYNVTRALVYCDVAKSEPKPKLVIHPTTRGHSPRHEFYFSGENVVATMTTPGLPYKLRRRMVKELGWNNALAPEWQKSMRRDLVRSARTSRLFWTAVLYASVLAMWMAVWWYAGVQYGK